MGISLGDFKSGSVVYVWFPTFDKNGGAAAFSATIEAADFKLYKDGSATQRTSTSGWTLTNSFDSITGLYLLQLDLSDDTDSGFYSRGSEFALVLDPSDETLDSETPLAVWQFSIEREPKPYVTGSVTNSPSDGSSLRDSSKSGTDNFYNGSVLAFTSGGNEGIARKVGDYDGTNREFDFSEDPFPATPSTGDGYVLLGQID